MNTRAIAFVFTATWLACASTARPAHARDTEANAAKPRRVVVLETSGSFEQGAVLEDTLRELLGRVGLVLDARGSATAEEVLATVRVEHDDAGANVVVRDARRPSAPQRKRVKRDDSVAVFREALAHVVLGAVEPLGVDEERAHAVAPPEAAAPRPRAPAPTETAAPQREAPPRDGESPWAFSVGTLGGGSTMGSTSGMIVAIGGSASVAHRGSLNPTLALSGRYAFPFEAGDDTVRTNVKLTSLRLAPEVEIVRVGAFGVAFAVGVGIDVVSITPSSTVLPTSRLGAPSTRVDPTLSPGLIGKLALARNVDLTLWISTDFDLASRSWVTDAGGVRTAVFAPSRARPFVAIGLDFTVAGAGRSAGPARGGDP